MKTTYLKRYIFDWDVIDTVVSGKSPIDSRFFLGEVASKEVIDAFLSGYGLDPSDPITRAELFGNFQEAVQFIKKYCLQEGSKSGLPIKIPNSIYMITDIDDLFVMATKKLNLDHDQKEEGLWAEIILKFMHTILHMDKDLRSDYFSTIQTQVFDRFYKYVYRDNKDRLFLGKKSEDEKIELLDFNTKSKKTRDSVLIKLLHKAENVAEELFDRVGVRFVTKNKFDTLRVVKYLLEKNIVIPHNIKPSRSVNTLMDIGKFKTSYRELLKVAIRKEYTEEEFNLEVTKLFESGELFEDKSQRNVHTSKDYRAIHFTGRNLIKYRNPFFSEFRAIRKLARKGDKESEINKKILAVDTSLIAREVKFFYPFEVQILDEESHKINSEGEASHLVYKSNQLKSVIKRVFGDLIKHKGIQYL